MEIPKFNLDVYLSHFRFRKIMQLLLVRIDSNIMGIAFFYIQINY